jgi:membrane protein
MANAFFTKIQDRVSSLWDSITSKAASFLSRHNILQHTWNVIKNSVRYYDDHDTSTLGAGLSYYMVFSIAPMLIIVISVAGSLLGPDAVDGEIKRQIQGVMGPDTAKEIQDMIKAAYSPGKNWIATTLSIIFLITGALGVFTQLRTSLNVIWDVKPGEKKPFLRYLLNRLFSFGFIISVGLLMIVSLAVNALVAGLSGYMGHRIPGFSKFLLGLAEIILSYGLATLLFALIYKFMSDVKIKWKSVWFGALFTSVLFAIGKYIIGIYIVKSNLSSTYGAASSLIIILLWVYYSAQIVFFGAEFTRALAQERGIPLETQIEPEKKTV